MIHGIFFATDHKRLSNDYISSGILFIDDAKNFTVNPEKSFTHDKEEAKLDYFREDPLFHVFHTLVHRVTHSVLYLINVFHESS